MSLFGRGFNKSPVLPSKQEDKITLDSHQSLAVFSSSPNNLVIAGAGSGKTRVLTERVKYLIEQGVSPSSIVAITFTNMASEEMKERLVNVEGIGDTFIGTIHSFANHIMKISDIEYTLYNRELDLSYHRYLIERYCKHLNYDRYLEYRDLRDDCELGKISQQELSSFLNVSEIGELCAIERKEDVNEEVSLLYPETINTLCKSNKVIDFNTLLKYADNYFRSLGTRVSHLLVDEFQDVGMLEYEFITGLNAENKFFVGDDYQSIYGFKGGNVDIFLSLINSGEFDIHFLTNNYRNCEEVLSVADTVINQVSKKIDKNIVPLNTCHGTTQVYSKLNLETVLRKTFLCGNNDSKFRDWFILTRTNAELFKVAGACQDLGIPCTSFKREGMSLSELRALMGVNSVKILTVHTAKGLESDNVIMYGNFPIHCPPYLLNEDERKVMYVGVTRARKNLIILN